MIGTESDDVRWGLSNFGSDSIEDGFEEGRISPEMDGKVFGGRVWADIGD